MVQLLHDIKTTDYIDTGLIRLLERDLTALTFLSGKQLPDNVPENVFSNNLTDKKFYTLNGGKWEKVIDYSSLHKTKGMLENEFQPLNHYLTEYSKVSVPSQGVICYNTFRPISNFFKTRLLSTTSVDSLSSLLGLGKIAFFNTLSSVYIKDGSVGKDKMSGSIITEPAFVSGDIRMSFNQVSPNTNEWLKLASNITIGNTGSGANYTGILFKKLFSVLWLNDNVQLLNSKGVSVKKGSMAENDWNSNYRIVLPDKPTIDTTEKTIQEIKEAKTYKFTVKQAGYYRIQLVGGGGGSSAAGGGGKYASQTDASVGAINGGYL